MLFLVGTILFKHTIRGFLQLSHGAGIVLLAALAWFAGGADPFDAVVDDLSDHDHRRGVGINLPRSKGADTRAENPQSEATSA